MHCASATWFRGGVAGTEVADQTFLLEFDERLECLGKRTDPAAFGIAHAHVDHVECLHPEGLEVLLDLLAQIFVTR